MAKLNNFSKPLFGVNWCLADMKDGKWEKPVRKHKPRDTHRKRAKNRATFLLHKIEISQNLFLRTIEKNKM